MVKAIAWRQVIAPCLALALPASATAGPLMEAAERAGREVASVQAESSARGAGRFWTSIALLAGGGALAVLGGLELSDSDTGPDEDNDADDEAGVDDGDAGEKLMLGGGIAAASVAAILLITGRRTSTPSVIARPGRLTVRHTVRF